jgi:hypothetical protein
MVSTRDADWLPFGNSIGRCHLAVDLSSTCTRKKNRGCGGASFLQFPVTILAVRRTANRAAFFAYFVHSAGVKKKNPTKAEDLLYAAAPPSVQKVLKESHRLRRLHERAVWWEKNGKGPK